MNEYRRCSTCIQCNTDVAAAAKSLQLCLTLCDPIDGCLLGSSIPGILQAGTLEWVAISFSNAWKWKVKVKSPSRVRLLLTLWIAAYQAPPSMGFSRQENWSGLPLPSPNGILLSHKKNEITPVAPTLMEIIILNEVSQKEPILYDTTYMWNLKCDTNEITFETETDSQT